MPIHETARYRVKPEAREKCEAAVREFIEYIGKHEPGTLVYTSLQEAEDATSFLHYYIFADEAARDRHGNGAGAKGFTDILYPVLVGDVEFTEYLVVADKS
jgi:quinol monooxygenase YgiN